MKLKHNIYRQLLTIVLFMFILMIISIFVVFPSLMRPMFEESVYSILDDSLMVVQDNVVDIDIDNDIAFIFDDGNVSSSSNLKDISKLNAKQIIKRIQGNKGTFTYKKEKYYYSVKRKNNCQKIAITNSNYIAKLKNKMMAPLIPVMLITLSIMLFIVALWSQFLASRIHRLIEKVDNLDNDSYKEPTNYIKIDDEIEELSHAIDEMKVTLQKSDEYKNQMYQNISHDFKTPLTVIKSYIEAIEDGVEDPKDAINIIKQELDKLEKKVHSLLYLNKLNYIKDTDTYKDETVNIVDVLAENMHKFEVTRPDVKWKLNIKDKKTIFKGTYDMWEAITYNLLANFIRYAKEEITITVRNHQIIFYNDGEKIDESIFTDIFTPYKKGVKGQFGLGLSIIKQTVQLLGYEINVRNEKKGVSFIIK